ncbi:MAG: beta/gamma crystallin-related protein [Pseudomonadota bacterium]
MVMKTLKHLAACLTAALTLTASPALADDDDLRTALRIAVEAGLFGEDVRQAVRSNTNRIGGGRYQTHTQRGEIVLYEDRDFRGRQLVIDGNVDSLNGRGFNNRASSVRVYSGRWQLCADTRYGGRCEIVDRNVSRLANIDLNDRITSVRLINPYQSHASSRLILFADSNYRGRQVTIDRYTDDLRNIRFNDIASSARVFGGAWQICADTRYGGRCEIVSRDFNMLSSIGLNNRITSVRPVNGDYSDYNHGHRNGGYDTGQNERLYGDRDAGYGYGSDRAFGIATVFADRDCRGRSLDVRQPIANLRDFGFNDRISSISVREGRFEVCSDANFRGRCRIISRDVGDLRDFGLNDTISSIRPVYDDGHYDDGGRRQYPY